VTLFNEGDTYDRANMVGVNNVTVLLFTTKENASHANNPVQSFTRDITEYSCLFTKPCDVYWLRLPDYQGGWSAELSFAFWQGMPEKVYPQEIIPVFFWERLRTNANFTSIDINFPEGITSAKAVLYEEGFGDEEFWFGRDEPTVRDFILQIDGNQVFDLTAYPYLNSGAVLGSPGHLYQWNGTPPPGTGIRPPHVVDISPHVELLENKKEVTFSIRNGRDYWCISLCFMLFFEPERPKYELVESTFRYYTPTQSRHIIFVDCTARRTWQGVVELISTSYRAWLNCSEGRYEVHDIKIVEKKLVNNTIEVEVSELEEVYFNITLDSSRAVDIDYSIYTSCLVSSKGNSQNYTRKDTSYFSRIIDGSYGGYQSREDRMLRNTTFGNYPNLEIIWSKIFTSTQKIEANMGEAQRYPPKIKTSGSGTETEFPGAFFLEPKAEGTFNGSISIKILVFNPYINSILLTIYNLSYNLTGIYKLSLDTTEIPNGKHKLNITITHWTEIISMNSLTINISNPELKPKDHKPTPKGFIPGFNAILLLLAILVFRFWKKIYIQSSQYPKLRV
jgi:hypothetical protein